MKTIFAFVLMMGLGLSTQLFSQINTVPKFERSMVVMRTARLALPQIRLQVEPECRARVVHKVQPEKRIDDCGWSLCRIKSVDHQVLRRAVGDKEDEQQRPEVAGFGCHRRSR